MRRREGVACSFPLTPADRRFAGRGLRPRPALICGEGSPLALPRSRGEREKAEATRFARRD